MAGEIREALLTVLRCGAPADHAEALRLVAEDRAAALHNLAWACDEAHKRAEAVEALDAEERRQGERARALDDATDAEERRRAALDAERGR